MSEAHAYEPGEVILRRARPDDITAVANLGIEAMRADPYPRMKISVDRVRAVARDVISGSGNFCCVAEVNGQVVAAVSALIHDCLFYEGKQASVVQFYTRMPGVGAPLIRAFLKWARGRSAIKSIVFTLEVRADPRIGKLLARMGLREELPVFMEIR